MTDTTDVTKSFDYLDEATHFLVAAVKVAGYAPEAGDIVVTMRPHAWRLLHREVLRGTPGGLMNFDLPRSGEFTFRGIIFREAR